MSKRLPNGWDLRRIEEFAKTKSGGTPKRSNPKYWGGNIPWLKSGELNDLLYIKKNSEFISEEGLKNSSASLFKKGTLLMAMYGATAGKLGILGMDAATNQAVCSIQNPRKSFVEKFLYYFLLLSRPKIIEDSSGGAQPNISKTYIDSIEIPLPPLPEQERIVAKLDTLFARIDEAIALLEENIAATERLMESVLDEVFRDAAEKWEMFELKKLGKFYGGGTPSKQNKNFWNGDIVWISPKDMKSKYLSNSELSITSLAISQSSVKEIPKNSLLFVTRSGILKHKFPLGINEVNCTINQDLKAFIPGKGLSTEFVYWMFRSLEQRILEDYVKTGVTVQSIIFSDFKEIMIPKPEKDEQATLVKKMSGLSNRIQEIKKENKERIDYYQSLKSSLLDQAFRGEL
ncbi:MAG: restriction endonuclease subunit S [Bacteroidia bacterium]|nr:restriction endonuclease subunit S [Bacteroidia bacterium]